MLECLKTLSTFDYWLLKPSLICSFKELLKSEEKYAALHYYKWFDFLHYDDKSYPAPSQLRQDSTKGIDRTVFTTVLTFNISNLATGCDATKSCFQLYTTVTVYRDRNVFCNHIGIQKCRVCQNFASGFSKSTSCHSVISGLC